MVSGLTSGADFLKDSAKLYFANYYQNPPIRVDQELDRNLNWTPSLQFKVQTHLTVLAEVSENPYPQILSMRRMDILDLSFPISVYCVCPEEAYLAHQGHSEAKKLILHGFGLLTVSSNGAVQRVAGCIPLIQRISEIDFNSEIKGLSPTIRRRLREAFDRYQASAPSGAADIAEVLEGFILKAGRDAVKKGWLQRSDAQAGQMAKTLDAMVAVPQFGSALAPIGGARAYVAKYRNASAHFPKSKIQAAIKYRDCRHGFLDGLKQISTFCKAMKGLGLTGGIAS
ncbi:hypothetical protein [Roseovarius pelagicus]|uniref:Apea-like HEPN domain-containing protein n=1 Tax=Roseovarius pelagicus TaxID=2980108 RepID=A0ABY6D6K9_9RHOB|nr:hypothetical protein [Roseovarius pelagicus]UXX81779.1 hypothetical protein N7U68_11635 [Roseovarius pelagicus]